MNLASLESLKIFCDVVREKSFSRGASMNEVSQSAASQAVLQIEKRLGVRLIDRTKRPLALTREGQIYYKECRNLVDRYLAVEARIRTRHDNEISRVNVASIYSVVLYDMNQYVQRFVARHPQYQVRFQYLHPDDVYATVLSGQADLGLVSFPSSRREFEVIVWRNEPMVLVCSPTHRFSALNRVAVEQLNGVDFVAFEPGLAIRRHVDRFLRQHDVEVNAVMAFDNIEFIKRGLETSSTVSILPEPTVRTEANSGSLRVIPMPELGC
jgi:DNA-binding transcriptional LysR family regulator